MSFSGNSYEHTQRAPQHLRLTKELRSTSGVSLAQEHLRATIASMFETVGARPGLRAVEDFDDGTELLVGAHGKLVVRVISVQADPRVFLVHTARNCARRAKGS